MRFPAVGYVDGELILLPKMKKSVQAVEKDTLQVGIKVLLYYQGFN